MGRSSFLASLAVLSILCAASSSPAIAQSAPRRTSPTSRPATRSTSSRFSDRDLNDPAPSVRRKAVQKLQQMNTRPYNAAPILIKMAKEELDQDVRQEAIRTLGWLYSTQRGRQIPPRQTEVRDNVISVLAAVMDDSDPPVRHACIRALHDIGRPAAALSGRFVEMIKDPTQSQTQIDAADALRSVDPNGEAILRSLLPESEAGAQYAIIWALSSSNTPENRNAIRPFLKSDDPKLLVAALHTVARMRPWDDDVLNQIESMCSADDERTRAAAINAATMDADPERLQRILQRAEKDTSARVISAVRNAKRRLATTRPARNETAPKTPEP